MYIRKIELEKLIYAFSSATKNSDSKEARKEKHSPEYGFKFANCLSPIDEYRLDFMLCTLESCSWNVVNAQKLMLEDSGTM